MASSARAADRRSAEPIAPGQLEAKRHFYRRVLNAQLHPLVRAFTGKSVNPVGPTGSRILHLGVEAEV